MHVKPILMMGGSGAIGRLSAQTLRSLHPEMPLLLAGRDVSKAQAVADELGNADAVELDLSAEDLGLGNRDVGAVAVFYADSRLAGLRFARARSLPHLNISSGVFEIAPEIATYMQKPEAGAVVLGYEWLVGATTVPTLELAKRFNRINSIKIGALVDEEDGGGPAVAEDFERLSELMPAALTLGGGTYIWREGEDAKRGFKRSMAPKLKRRASLRSTSRALQRQPARKTFSSISQPVSVQRAAAANRSRRRSSSSCPGRDVMVARC